MCYSKISITKYNFVELVSRLHVMRGWRSVFNAAIGDHVATGGDLYEPRGVDPQEGEAGRSMNVKVIYATRWSLKLAGKKRSFGRPAERPVLDKLVKTP